jgi:hypothetical protein
MAKRGRKPIEINWMQVMRLCEIKCSNREIEYVTGVDIATLRRAVQKEYGLSWGQYRAKWRAHAKADLRRWQFECARMLNVRMLIHLGQEYLGQKGLKGGSGNTAVQVNVHPPTPPSKAIKAVSPSELKEIVGRDTFLMEAGIETVKPIPDPFVEKDKEDVLDNTTLHSTTSKTNPGEKDNG